jgi:hypothetical protein
MMKRVARAMMMTATPAMAEPAMRAVRDEVREGGGEVRRDVTIGVTIWEIAQKSNKVS